MKLSAKPLECGAQAARGVSGCTGCCLLFLPAQSTTLACSPSLLSLNCDLSWTSRGEGEGKDLSKKRPVRGPHCSKPTVRPQGPGGASGGTFSCRHFVPFLESPSLQFLGGGQRLVWPSPQFLHHRAMLLLSHLLLSQGSSLSGWATFGQLEHLLPRRWGALLRNAASPSLRGTLASPFPSRSGRWSWAPQVPGRHRHVFKVGC